jgi:N,N'-diacetyllegionaminate synthase
MNKLKKNKIFIVAEIGNNHEGNFKNAKKLINEAEKCGVDAVKFQTFIPELYVSKKNKKRFKLIKKFQLSFKQFKQLALYARKKKLIFFSTPLDLKSAKYLNNIQSIFKIASGDNNFIPLIKTISSFNKRIILSTGLADLKHIKKIKSLIYSIWRKQKYKGKLSILHCVSSYPVDPKEANLSFINVLKENFQNCTIGYSDHTKGVTASIAAVALGAKIIEKHFTLNNNFSKFRDHKISANPHQMKYMVRQIRKIEVMIGNEKIEIQNSEKKNSKSMRRSIVAKRDIKIGSRIKIEDLNWIRIPGGISPGNEKKILNKRSLSKIKEGEKIVLTKIK